MPTSPTRRRAAQAIIASSVMLTLGMSSAWATPGQLGGTTAAVPLSQGTTVDESLDFDWESTTLVGDVDPSFETGDLPPASDAPTWSSAQAPAEAAANAWFVAPVAGPATSAFGLRFHPILHYTRMHNGVDMTAACGTPVAAAAAGRVTFVGPNGGYGNLVVIDHGVVQGARMQTKYAHLSAFSTKVGDLVSPGTQIGLAGTTGLSTGCHLHFEIKLNGVYVNPAAFLTGAPTVIPTLPPGAITTAPTEASALKARIRFCESSNNYQATNPTSTASGAYQFLDGTWALIPTSIRGTTTRALYATPAQQDAAFDWLFARDGSRPWLASQACWGSVLNVPTTVLLVQQTAAAATATPSATPTATATETPTATPSATDTPTPSATATPSPSATTPTPTTSGTPSSSVTPTTPVATTPSASATTPPPVEQPAPEPVAPPEPVVPDPEPVAAPEPTQTQAAPAPTTAAPTRTATAATSEPTTATVEKATPKATASATPTEAPVADG